MDIQATPTVKIIIGLIYSKDSRIEDCIHHLESTFGKIDHRSITYDFNITNYYESEMGNELIREFVSFHKLIEPQQLPNIKTITNIIEKDYSEVDQRRINLDPGYLDMDKFVLASAKYGRQKIYLDKGIYADPTLFFFSKEFHAYEWSFPDFKSGIYNDYFIKVRHTFKDQIKNK